MIVITAFVVEVVERVTAGADLRARKVRVVRRPISPGCTGWLPAVTPSEKKPEKFASSSAEDSEGAQEVGVAGDEDDRGRP